MTGSIGSEIPHILVIWERAIRPARAILNSLLLNNTRSLDDEVFHTLICEVENIRNCRPVTTEAVTDGSCPVLTPNHILTMKSQVVLQKTLANCTAFSRLVLATLENSTSHLCKNDLNGRTQKGTFQ